MAFYPGRTDQSMEVQNFLGINSKSSVLSSRDGEAIDIVNWDVDMSGAITRRKGYEVSYSGFTNVYHLDSFFVEDGSQVYIAVADGKFYSASSPAGPWTDRGAHGMTEQNYIFIGQDFNGQYVLANGIDAPIVYVPGSNVQTLKDASILYAPTGLTIASSGASAVTQYQYVVTAITPRGETTVSAIANTFTGPPQLDINNFNTLNWVAVPGAFAYIVYRYNTADNAFHPITQTVSTSYLDNGAPPDVFLYPPTSNTAYNTPLDWETTGQPEGFYILSKGKNQRMIAWRGSSVWVSALDNIYDWYTDQDAFSFIVQGGQSNNIRAIATLFDYTLFFSATNTFAYAGSSVSDFQLVKVQNTGCQSHYSIIPVGDDVYVWGQRGPTTVNRILQGADLQTTPIALKVQDFIFDRTYKDNWKNIRGWHDINNQRVCWCVPTGPTAMDTTLAYNYNVRSWTKFEGWSVLDTTVDPVAQKVYASIYTGPADKIVELHSGLTDGGSSVVNSYNSVFYDMRTWLRKRIPFVDILVDPKYPYSIFVQINQDYGRTSATQSFTLTWDGTTAMTDGRVIDTKATAANFHRIYTSGDARAIQFVFEDNTPSGYQPARVLGWRPDCRVRGVR